MRNLSTWLLGAPLVFGFFAIEATFRAAGDTRTPFLMLAASVGVSILLDPLLIMGLGPLPRLGVEGAALASVMVRSGRVPGGSRHRVASGIAGASAHRTGGPYPRSSASGCRYRSRACCSR